MESSLKAVISANDTRPEEVETRSYRTLMEKLQESTFFQTVDIELYENGNVKKVHKEVNWKVVATIVFGAVAVVGFILYKADTRKVNQILDHVNKKTINAATQTWRLT